MALSLQSKPSRSECKYVAANLRREEEVEFKRMMQSPGFAAMESVGSSAQSFVVRDGDEPVALCGIVDEHKDLSAGIVWLMSSNKVKKQPIAFYKIIKELVSTYGHLYDMLYNYVETSAAEHAFFIESLGFVISDEVYLNEKSGVMYYRFEYMTPKILDKLYHEGTE